jgi:hypothetical protein
MATMPFEYRVVHTVDEANQLAEQGFELFQILPPGPNGGPDRLYLRREKPKGQSPGFLASTGAATSGRAG